MCSIEGVPRLATAQAGGSAATLPGLTIAQKLAPINILRSPVDKGDMGAMPDHLGQITAQKTHPVPAEADAKSPSPAKERTD
jgi:hypothetical protein